MSKSKLFVPFMLRFSLINDQHVEVMNLLDELIKSDKRSKNQVVMDALEYYFQREINGQESEQNFVDIETFESRIAKEREKLRAEIYQDIIGFLAGSALSGGIKNVTINPMKHETENSKEGDALVICLDGIGEITIDDKKHELHEGETIVMPAKHPHAVLGKEQFKMLLVVVF